jgi:hypothetical protein
VSVVELANAHDVVVEVASCDFAVLCHVRFVERSTNPLVEAGGHTHTDFDFERLVVNRRDVLLLDVVWTELVSSNLSLDRATRDRLDEAEEIGAIDGKAEATTGESATEKSHSF